ncbi:twin-arginine translocase TatA/TatE family subunit [Kribbella pratensis]|uniref:Sec-independent protein translocase protein TatA n=1 Tax=Kribbella pratensis TaxID=2512112 RepID=A0A4R8C473_9ACTN|nr:twin-arginine translocase TatA/TatE family subunit [Kribbella pratensis]TDW69935.1 sec-independent protein translocase protein TatA [Kribbella pratensis]
MVPLLALPEGGEWIVILVIVVLLFGAKKLPELTKNAARAMKEFEKARHGDDDDETPAQVAPTQAQPQAVQAAQAAPVQATQAPPAQATQAAPTQAPQAPPAQTAQTQPAQPQPAPTQPPAGDQPARPTDVEGGTAQ